MRLLIDMDEVICDFLGALCDEYNRIHFTNLTTACFSHYELKKTIGDDGCALFLRAGFFDKLNAFPHAIEVLEMLHGQGHDIIVATHALGHAVIAADKVNWMLQHLPFLIPDNFMIVSRKNLIDADLIFEDSPSQLERFTGVKVVMDRPYNRQAEGHRIYNNDWLAFADFVQSCECQAELKRKKHMSQCL